MTSKSHEPLTTIMAFDYGTQKIGVAVGQTVTSTASALPVLAARDGIPDWDHLARLIDEWKPDAFVVGIPMNRDGTPGDISKRAQKFGRRLTGRFNRPSYEINEHLSTYDARDQITTWSARPPRAGRPVDSIAAVLILESWFESKWPTIIKDHRE